MNKKGFTLIELMIVVAIIGVIAAIIIPNILLALQKAKQKSTMEDMRNLGHALQMYDESNGVVPQLASITDLAGHAHFVSIYIRMVPLRDQWGRMMTYQHGLGEITDGAGARQPVVNPTESDYLLVSGGKDGQANDPPALPWKINTMQDFNWDIHYSSGGFSQAPSRTS